MRAEKDRVHALKKGRVVAMFNFFGTENFERCLLSMIFKYVWLLQSHLHIEVAQGGVFSRTRHNSLLIFSLY